MMNDLPENDVNLTIKTMNEWMADARRKPAPRPLFGEFWLEGELAVVFGETGVGKSLLAVQIAESIARGRALFPSSLNPPPDPARRQVRNGKVVPRFGVGKLPTKPQKVLYFDFELSEKQLEMRYTEEPEPGRWDLKRHHRFSDKVHRIEVDPNCPLPDGFRFIDEYFVSRVERHVRETGARVVIIDNISHLKRSYGSARDSIRLMNNLNRLKKSMGLSILVVAHSRRRTAERGLSAGYTRSAAVIAESADSVFAIGQSGYLMEQRYLKQLKSRSTEMVYDTGNVVVFEIKRMDDNFLGFQYYTTGPESCHLGIPESAGPDWESINEMKKLRDEDGWSIREIADVFGMSKSTVHRMLQIPEPTKLIMERENAERGMRNAESEAENAEEAAEEPIGAEQNEESPGEEWTDEPADDDEEELPEETDIEDHSEFTGEPADDEPCDQPQNSEISATPANSATPATSNHPFADHPLPLTIKKDGYGDDIYVESECEITGKPKVWFKADKNGFKFRNTRMRGGDGIYSECLGRIEKPLPQPSG